MTVPQFHTARLTLVPAGPADLDVLWEHWRGAAVRRYLWDDVAISRELPTFLWNRRGAGLIISRSAG
jgi:hypothetical protein